MLSVLGLFNTRTLIEECRRGDLAQVKKLVDQGCNVNEETDILSSLEGPTSPLQVASYHGHSHVVRYLLEHNADVNATNFAGASALHYACRGGHSDIANMLISKGADIDEDDDHGETPLMIAASEGHHQVVKALILCGARVNLSSYSKITEITHTAFTAAASNNHIHCGILLIEGGADIYQYSFARKRINILNYSSTEFRAAVQQTLSFHSKKTICVIGNTCSGKSTLITSLQNENASLLRKGFNWIFGVKDIRQRAAGIEPVSLSSKRYGEVVLFDFAGQHEYHGPHEIFLESMLTKSGSTLTIILVVKVTEEESVISQQLYRWLVPISKMCSSSSPVRVIVVGSFLDQVKSKAQAQEKLIHCIQRIQEDLKDAAMEFQGTCFLNCRQPYSSGIDQLCQWLDKVPTPQYKAMDKQYSISWVISRIGHTCDQQAITLDDFSKWIDDNRADLPTNLPPAEVVCSDLSATGHFLFLPNEEDLSKSWLVLDLAAILHDVYGKLFSSKNIVDQFGLLKTLNLQCLFPTLNGDMVCNVLIALEFCIEVDPTFLSEEITKLKGSEEDDFLFFPALVSAQQPEAFPGPPTDSVLPTLCWQLQADDKHFISPRLLQTVILRLAAHKVFHHQLGRNSREHCCSVWWNGISWQSPNGVDVSVQISDNALVQVLGRSKAGPDVLCQYISEITFDIITTIQQLLPDFSASSYIIRTSDSISLLKQPKNLNPHAMIPFVGVFSVIKDGEEFCLSRPDRKGQCASLSVSDLFSGVRPSLDTVQKLCFECLVCDGVRKGRKRTPEHGSSSSKRKEPSIDSEESDSSASSETSEDKPKKRRSKSTKRSRSYSEVTVRDVIRRMTREKLHKGIKKMLTEHRTNLLFDDWGLINEECRDDILGDLGANKKTKAANRLIDYFDNNHAGEELLLFCDFLTKAAKKAGRNPQLLKLAKAIKEAAHDSSPGPSEPGKGKVERAAPRDNLHTEVKIPPHEKDLCRLCWVPFGMQTLKVSPVGDGHTYELQPNTVGCHEEDLIRLEIPKDAINSDVCKELSIRYGILVHGPFVLEEDYELGSMVVYIDFNMDHTTKPLMLHLPHWASEGEAANVAVAPHKVDEKEQYKFANKSLLPLATGSIPIYGHCSLFAKAVKVKSQKFYYAHPLESREDTETKLSVYFTYASTVWSEIIQCHVAKCESPSKFELGNKDILNAVLEEYRGSGWEADFIRNNVITQGIIRYNSNSEDDLKKEVCDLKSYPPFVQCMVQCTRRVLEGGRKRQVKLVFNKTCHNAFMSFACTTFSEEPIGGHASSFGSNFTPPASPSGAKRYSVSSSQPSSKKKRTSYSHITAVDVVQGFGKEALIKKFKLMLTDHRTVLLEDRDLIDSDCRDSIQAKLRLGQRAGAATELVKYFEDNHNGDKMMAFCTFLEDQAGNTSPQLVQLANIIRECVKTLSGSS